MDFEASRNIKFKTLGKKTKLFDLKIDQNLFLYTSAKIGFRSFPLLLDLDFEVFP